MRISPGLGKGWKPEDFMHCAISIGGLWARGDSAAIVSGKGGNWREARLAQF